MAVHIKIDWCMRVCVCVWVGGWVGRSFVEKGSRVLSDVCVISRWGSLNILPLGEGQKTALHNPKDLMLENPTM